MNVAIKTNSGYCVLTLSITKDVSVLKSINVLEKKRFT